jgi:quercetin dioxygenase-like cupin family protein
MPKNENANNLTSLNSDLLADYFTSAPWTTALIPKNYTCNNSAVDLSFERGSIYSWHSHPGLQILIVTDGIGYYQETGKAVQLLTKGQVIFIQPNTPHWHTASPGNDFTHVHIRGNESEEIVTWLQKVNEQYNG